MIITLFIMAFVFLPIFQWKDFISEIHQSINNKSLNFEKLFGNWLWFANATSYFIYGFLLLFLYKKYIKGTKNLPYKLRSLKLSKKEIISLFSLTFILFLGTYITSNFIFKPPQDFTQIKEVDSFFEIKIISPLIKAPITEEILFRGIFFNMCLNKKIVTKKNSKILIILVIIVSSLFFAFIHTFKFDYGFFIRIPISLLLGYVYYKYKNIKINMFIHFLFNLFF